MLTFFFLFNECLGTLTKEGLDFFGLHPIQNAKFKTLEQDFTRFSPLVQDIMKSCHSLTLVQNDIVGNFVDVEMFKATEGKLEIENGIVRIFNSVGASRPLKIIKRFAFVHSHAYMSVIVQDELSGRLSVYLKG